MKDIKLRNVTRTFAMKINNENYLLQTINYFKKNKKNCLKKNNTKNFQKNFKKKITYFNKNNKNILYFILIEIH